MEHYTKIVTRAGNREVKVLCACGWQSQNFPSVADAEESADHHKYGCGDEACFCVNKEESA